MGGIEYEKWRDYLLLLKCYKRSDYKGNGARGKDVKWYQENDWSLYFSQMQRIKPKRDMMFFRYSRSDGRIYVRGKEERE